MPKISSGKGKIKFNYAELKKGEGLQSMETESWITK